MSRFRDIKREARRDLHQEMSVAALYIPAPNAAPVPCTVRVHRKPTDPFIADSSIDAGARTVVTEDQIRFFLPELPSIRRINAIVSVEAGEAYRIDFLYPVDDEWQTARVTPLSSDEAAGLPVP